MNISSCPRHKRQGFIHRVISNGLAYSTRKGSSVDELLDSVIIDFSPPSETDIIETNFLAELAEEIYAESELIDFSPFDETEYAPSLPAAVPEQRVDFAPNLQLQSRHAKLIHTESLPDGIRQETFDNGSILNKDALGRVVAVYSNLGECLLLTYDQDGELSEFVRINLHGDVHSSAKKGRRSILVRDAKGRAKAIGQSMTIDPWGRFYLHANDKEYFCIDLIEAVHVERRRLVTPTGQIIFVTAAFTYDGFRMATAYATPTQKQDRWRDIRYRFYGRDGSVLEFDSCEDLRDQRPSQSKAPCTMPVHESWATSRQARTAWESFTNICGGPRASLAKQDFPAAARNDLRLNEAHYTKYSNSQTNLCMAPTQPSNIMNAILA